MSPLHTREPIRRWPWLLALVLALGCGLAAFWSAGWWSATAVELRDEPARATSDVASRASSNLTEEPPDAGAARRPAGHEPSPARELVLVLERFPDRAPVANVLVDVQPRADEDADAWFSAAADGRASVRVPANARSVRVAVAGFEVAERELAPDAPELRVALTPSSGLFGRVLGSDGAPAAGVRVDVRGAGWSVQLDLDPRRPKPLAHAREGRFVAASATTNAEGWYFLDYATDRARDPARLEASLGTLAAMRTVELPRAPGAVPDLYLSAPTEVLFLRVTDPGGRPIAGALVHCPEHPLPSDRDETDERGELAIHSPELPASFSAFAPLMRPLEARHDGQWVSWSTAVESPATRVELVLEPLAGARVRVVDAETRFPLYMVQGRCELRAGDRDVGRSDFETDRDGLAWVTLADTYQMADPPVAPEVAHLVLDERGYEPQQTFELEATVAHGPEPIELALRPLAGSALLRGRVVRAGEPLPQFQVGLKVQPRVADPQRRGWQYGRVVTDPDGRFALRWTRVGAGHAITVYPHWTSWDEFAFLGPMSEAEATAGEHVLELRPARRVPAIVRGVARGGAYRYYVSLVEGEGESELVVSTTINGVPIAAESDGELHTLLRLPADRRVQVTIGYAAAGRVVTDGCKPVVHDPAQPRVPLVFELEPLFLRVHGRVAGFTAAELPNVGVALVARTREDDTGVQAFARVDPDGSFQLQANRGDYEIFLIEKVAGFWSSTIHARRPLTLERDVEGLLLAPEAALETPR